MTRTVPLRAVPLLLGGAVGLAGLCLPGALFDGPTFLAWLACVALPVGLCLGDERGGPWLLAVPAAWGLAMIWLGLDVERTVPRPLGGLAVVGGLYLAGLGLGSVTRLWPVVALLVVGLAAGPLTAGLGEAGRAPRVTPVLARTALELSPVGWTLECSGWDWSHADRDLYERSGVEFAPRHPHRARRTGLTILVLGVLVASVGLRLRRRLGTET